MDHMQSYIYEVNRAYDLISKENIELFINILDESRLNGSQVFIMGNGGSASTASHFVCDLAKNTRRPNWPLFRVIGLTDNMAIFSAYANDEGYENVFSEQLANLIQPNDVVVGISASGNSPNVLKAIEFANNAGAKTVGLSGYAGGKLGQMVHLHINVPSDQITVVEDLHLMLEHIITRRLTELTTLAIAIEETAGQMLMDNGNKDLVRNLFGKPVVTRGQMSVERAQSSMQMFYKISQEFADKLDLHNLLKRILKLTLESIGAESGSIAVMDEKGEIIDGAVAHSGQFQTSSFDDMAAVMQSGLAGWVIENRRPALVNNTKEDPRWLRRDWEDAHTSSRSAISVPLMTHDRVVGVVTLSHPEPGKFTMEDLAMLTAITITISYSNKGLQEQQ